MARSTGPLSEQSPDAVERQVSAYNAGDLESFLLCFAEGVVVEDADGTVRSTGRDALRESYGRLLAEHPDQEYEIVTRIRVGSWVVDEEHITGGPRGEVRAIAIYHLDGDGLIDQARFLVPEPRQARRGVLVQREIGSVDQRPLVEGEGCVSLKLPARPNQPNNSYAFPGSSLSFGVRGGGLFVPAGWPSRDPLQSASTRRKRLMPAGDRREPAIAELSQRLSQRAQATAK